MRGRRRNDSSPGQLLDLLNTAEDRTPRTRTVIAFPDEPTF
ncbi:hypothetical protein [Quadrisphaera granulorum]|nr:hypothetical protein [Quadrisphaera granulorum]